MKTSFLMLFTFLITPQLASAQVASDYFPLHVGNYWVEHTDSLSGMYYPTTLRRDIEGVDIIHGEEYFRMGERYSVDDGSYEWFMYSWAREDSTGILFGAFGFTNILDSAAIFDQPVLWLPNEAVNVGYTWEFDSYEWGGHFAFSVESVSQTVEVPAGTFNNCIKIGVVGIDTTGDTTEVDYFYFAEGVGEVLWEGWMQGWENFRFELIEYSIQLSSEDNPMKAVPIEFFIQQNYPNPFNPITTLRYDLPERSEVTLTIYDILGRQVRALVQDMEEPGYKSVIWDGTDEFGRNVGTGIYLYQIKASDFTETRKMLLLR